MRRPPRVVQFDAPPAIRIEGTEIDLFVLSPVLIDPRFGARAVVQSFNGHLLHHDRLALDSEQARRKYAKVLQELAPTVAIRAAMTALLTLAAQVREAISQRAGNTEDREDDAREQQSLEAPNMVCVAHDENEDPVYVVFSDAGALAIAAAVPGVYRGETVQHVPPRHLGWELPAASEVLTNYAAARHSPSWTATLLADVEDWLRSASDLGRPDAYLLLALHILLSWAQEHTDYLAIIVLEAEPERGKSRCGQAWMAVARHGIWLQGMREANLIRAAGDQQASMFLDMMDLWKKAESAGCEDILLGRFERGGQVQRVLYPDKGAFEDTVTYPVFGPTMIATNEPIQRILDTRALRIDMPLTTRTFTGRVRPEAARPLLARLAAWRALSLTATLPQCAPPADGRLGDILRPLQQLLLLVAPERAKEFGAIVSWQVRRRHDDMAGSTEAAIIEAVTSCEETLSGEYLQLQQVLEVFNRDRPEGWTKTGRWLGGKLRKLGWTIERAGHHNIHSLKWDAVLLAILRRRYGLTSDDAQAPPHTADHASHASHESPSSDEGATHCDSLRPEGDSLDSYESQAEHGPASGERGAATHATRATRIGDYVEENALAQEFGLGEEIPF